MVAQAKPSAVRLFVALFPGEPALAHLADVVGGLAGAGASSYHWADREGWHVTLAFLGDVTADRVLAAQDAVAQAAASHHRLALRLTGGGTFGPVGRQILWVGLGGDVAELRALATSLRESLTAARLTFDTREYVPHLTVARPGGQPSSGMAAGPAPADAARHAAAVATLDTYVGPVWTAETVELVASGREPTPAGPRHRYRRLFSAPIGR